MRPYSLSHSAAFAVAGLSLTARARLNGVIAFSAVASSTRSTITSSLDLQNPSLLPPAPSPTTETFDVLNPAAATTADDTAVVAQVPLHTSDDARRAIEDAARALPSWRDKTTPTFRSDLLKKWAGLMQDNKQDIAKIMSLESGKPLQESLGEVGYATSFLEYYAAEVLRPSGMVIPTTFSNTDGSPRGHLMAVTQAVGVTALITPWNFPLAMITRKVGPALAAGCTAVVKPSELTPLTALAAQHLAMEAGIPPSVLQTLTPDRSHTPDVGRVMCTHPSVAKLSFTGSTAVGKLLLQQSSQTIPKVSLELGGNAPFVVFEDADMDVAVRAAMASKFRNTGQTCVCSDRFLIHASIHDEFMERFKDAAIANLKVGDPLREGTTLGPLIESAAAERVRRKVQQAVDEFGATVVWKGQDDVSSTLGPNFCTPTILGNVDIQSDIWKTETFGPVAACRSFETEEEALEICNDSRVGLAGYFCTSQLDRAFSFARKLECGLVGVNEGVISTVVAPFGGVKESGLGREGSPMGLQEYLETKYVFMSV